MNALIERDDAKYIKIKNNISLAEEQLKRARWAKFYYEQAKIKEKYGLSVGDIVLCKKTEKRVKITEIFIDYEKLFITGKKEKKGGEYSLLTSHLYSDWLYIDREK